MRMWGKLTFLESFFLQLYLCFPTSPLFVYTERGFVVCVTDNLNATPIHGEKSTLIPFLPYVPLCGIELIHHCTPMHDLAHLRGSRYTGFRQRTTTTQ